MAVIGLAMVEAFAPPQSLYTSRVNNNIQSKVVFPAQSTTSFNTKTITSTTTSLNLFGLDDDTTQKLIVLSYEKLIEAGIPAVFFILTTAWFLAQFRDKEDGPARSGGRRGGGMMVAVVGVGDVVREVVV